MLKKINKKIKLVDVVVSPKKPAQLSDAEYRTNPRKTVLYSGLKMAGVAMITLILSASLSSIGSTVSYFSDVEASISNYLKADPLSFSVLIASSTSAQIDLSHGEQTVVPVMTPGVDSELVQYFVTAVQTGGDSAFCGAIHVFSTFPFPYDNSLLSLQTSTTTSDGSWSVTFSVPDASLFSNTSCTVDLIYKGWNADVPFGKGYNDTQKISLTFYVPDVPVVPAIVTDTSVATSSTDFSSTTPPLATTTPDNATTTTVVPDAPLALPPPDLGGATGGGDIAPADVTSDTTGSTTIDTTTATGDAGSTTVDTTTPPSDVPPPADAVTPPPDSAPTI